jgi:aminoglycoside phosphotransferase (APT) family kinase protein
LEQPGDGLRAQVGIARNLTVGDGFWSREQLACAYAQATNRPLEHFDVCLGLACLKLAVIAESIHYRYRSGHALDPLSAGLEEAALALVAMGLGTEADGISGFSH